jgi:DUF971 family protein
MTWPSELRLNAGRDALYVTFDNGDAFVLRAEYLRVESPSAEIRNHGGPKTILKGKAHVKITALEPVGNYAVRITFDDGHDSGLYSWDYLHQLGAEHDAIWAAYLAASGA